MLGMLISWLIVQKVSFLGFLKGIFIIIILKQGIINVYSKALILIQFYHIYWEMRIGELNFTHNVKKHLFYHINHHQIQMIQTLFKKRVYIKSQILFKNLILSKNIIFFKNKVGMQ